MRRDLGGDGRELVAQLDAGGSAVLVDEFADHVGLARQFDGITVADVGHLASPVKNSLVRWLQPRIQW